MENLSVECLMLIFNELTDAISLHSCLLINREWCCFVVPILWKKHSRNLCDGKSKYFIFNTILYFLRSSSKQNLSVNGIKLSSTILLKPPLFNYIDFFKFSTPRTIDDIVG